MSQKHIHGELDVLASYFLQDINDSLASWSTLNLFLIQYFT